MKPSTPVDQDHSRSRSGCGPLRTTLEHPIATHQFEAKLLIGGTSPDGISTTPINNPADLGAEVGRVHLASPEQTRSAVEAAQASRNQWAQQAAAQRAAALTAAARRIQAEARVLAQLLSAEHGKPLAEARTEISAAVAILDWHAAQADVLADEVVDHPTRGRQVRRRVPFGVVAVIVPWNYPVLLAHLMVAPALLAGNSVVVKLPDHSPLALAQCLDLLAQELSQGVLNVVAGGGVEVGEELTRHPLVRKIAFTGSTPTGRRIMSAASGTLKSVSLELGGNDAAVVLPNTPLVEDVVDGLLVGALTNAGQVCYAPKRIYVHEPQRAAFCDAMVETARTWAVGDPTDPTVRVGPINNEGQVAVLQSLLEAVSQEGATLLALGAMQDGLPPGHWFQPLLATDLAPDSALVRREQFGPLVPVIGYETVEQAVAMANDAEFGLAASVWSDDEDKAFAVASRLDAGTVFVNVHRAGASAVDMPFGGMKQSGVGRGHGIEGIHEYTELQLIAQRRDMRSA